MKPVTPRAAATILLLRENGEQLEIFLQKRNPKATFVGGVHVFPGGKVDNQDFDFPQELLSLPSQEAPILNQTGGLPSVIAAIRECFEEAGVLIARNKNNETFNVPQSQLEKFEQHRRAVLEQELTFAEFCRQEDIILALDEMAYISRWITPEISPMRFDTHFFVAPMPAQQTGIHDGYESIESVWMTPTTALTKQRSGEIDLILPTIRSLEQIEAFNTVHSAMEYFRESQPTPTTDPQLLSLDGQIELVHTPSFSPKS